MITVSIWSENIMNSRFIIKYCGVLHSVFVIDFKGLYGSSSEKVRKHHAKGELSELNGQITALEVSTEWLKHRIELLKYAVKTKIASQK